MSKVGAGLWVPEGALLPLLVTGAGREESSGMAPLVLPRRGLATAAGHGCGREESTGMALMVPPRRGLACTGTGGEHRYGTSSASQEGPPCNRKLTHIHTLRRPHSSEKHCPGS